MRKLKSLIFLFLIAVSTPALPSAPVPRKSPEFTITEPSGKTTLLSSFKGKVVVIEFLFVKSQHCVRLAQILNQLNGELGPRGFQAVGIAFDAPDPTKTGGPYLGALLDSLKLGYPVGYSSAGAVDAYLGRTGTETLAIPQLVVIDRAGVIRAATGRATDPKLEDENSLRALIEGLLKEGASAGPAKK
jgi:peroxiredoxin